MSDDPMAAVPAALQRLEQGFTRLETRLEQELTQLETRLETRLEQGLTRLEARLDQDVTRLDQGIMRLEQGQDRLRGDVMARMDRMQETLTQVQSEITVNFANTERVDKRAQSAHDEIKLVTEMVTEMVRTVRRLETRVATLEEPKR